MVAQRSGQHHPDVAPAAPTLPAVAPAPAPTNGAAVRGAPLLPVLALINGSALLALVVVVLRPTALGAMQQVVTLLALWLLVNLLVVVLVRLIDSGRTGTARVGLTPQEVSMTMTVGRTKPEVRTPSRVVPDPVPKKS